MTYDEIVSWAKEAYPFHRGYATYTEWLSDVESDFDSQGHFFPEQCYPLMEKTWNEAHEKNKVISLESYDQNESLKNRLVYRLEFREPQDTTPIETARNLKLNPNTTRRLFAELVRDGILRRTKRGHYQYVGNK